MKKRVTLLRHAKSSWENANIKDLDRPLNGRGKNDAPMMGKRLKERGARPSLILTSPAKRARKTARLIADELSYPREFIQTEQDLYLATPDRIITVLQRLENEFNDVIVCGHNPGITDLANHLGDLQIDNVPTCGVVEIDLGAGDWSGVAAVSGQTAYFDYPKKPA